MKDSTVFVGLDYHQDSVQVCVMDGPGHVLRNDVYENDASVIATVAENHGMVVHAAIESCTGAADLADELAQRPDWSVDLAHPGFVARMKQNPDKTDFTDARLLADLERVGYLPRVWLAPQEVRELRRLVRYRQQLVDERRRIKLRISALLRDQRSRCPFASSSKGWLSWLKSTKEVSKESQWILKRHVRRLGSLGREIREVEARLTRVTKKDSLVAALKEQKGVGSVTAWTIRAEIGRFDRFRKGKQLSRFCGLSPRNASSGTRVADAGLIKAGHRQLRATLIETAHRLIRYDEPWKDFADKLLNRGKPKCVVVAAVANRWMRRLFHKVQPGQLAA
jgi:transposase